MTKLSAGAFRHKLQLEAPSFASDGAGGQIASWSTVASFWGAVRPASGDERLAAHKFAGRVCHEVTVRFRTDLAPEMRLRLGVRTLYIKSVTSPHERRRCLVCLCEERDL
ncbi:MAG: phage head closure protein [Hyphomicrobiaceae bacterium]